MLTKADTRIQEFQKHRKKLYETNYDPLRAYRAYKKKYKVAPKKAWAESAIYKRGRKMTIASQLKFSRYCCRHSQTPEAAIKLMQLETGDRFSEYVGVFMIAVREWESRVDPKIKSNHASTGWYFKPFSVALEDLDRDEFGNFQFYTERWTGSSVEELNQRVTNWFNLSDIERQKYINKKAEEVTKQFQEQQARAEAYRQEHQERWAREQREWRDIWERLNSDSQANPRILKNAYQDISALKKDYRRLCLVHHPDHGGSDRDFIQLNSEYEQLKRRF